MSDKFFKLIKNILLTIIFVLLAFILVSRLFISIDFDLFEGHISHARLLYFFDFITIILVLGLIAFKRFTVPDKLTKILVLLIPLVIGLGCLAIYKYPLGADSFTCWLIADLYNETNDITAVMNAMDKYLQMYPYQYGFISILRVFDFIFNSEVSYQIFQVVVVSISNLALYKLLISKVENNSGNINAWYLIISIFWVVPWLLSPYAYGFALGLAFAIFSVYYFNKYLTTQRIVYLFPCFIFSILAVYVKMNYVILLMAYILLIIFIIRYSLKKKIILTLITSFTMVLSMNMVDISAKLFNNLDLPKGTPIISWFVMSSPVDQEEIGVLFNPYPTVGYYSGYNYDLAKKNNYDEAKMDDVVKEDLKYVLKYIKQNPAKSLKYYALKTIDTWDSNDFLARQYMVGEGNKDVDSPVVINLNNGFTGFTTKILTNVGSAILLLGSLVYIIKHRRNSDNIYLLLFIWFIGGFLYHLLFETKAVYVYPYMTILMPIATMGLYELQEMFKSFVNSDKKHKNYVYATVPLVLIVAFIYNTQKFVLPTFESYADVPSEALLENDCSLIQTITLEENVEIDAIEFEYSGSLNENVLEITIADDSSVLETISINQMELDKSQSWIRKSFDSINLSKDKKYSLNFSILGDGYSDFTIIYGPTSWDNDSVIINGEEYQNSTINFKLLTKEYSRWYYYQNNKVQYVSDMYYN